VSPEKQKRVPHRARRDTFTNPKMFWCREEQFAGLHQVCTADQEIALKDK
jgi:hypothetical protein